MATVLLDGSNPAVVRVRQLIDGTESSDGWTRCWEEGLTPWDLGEPTPAVVELVKSGTLPGGGGTTATVLVPGCGGGYDAVALSGAGRFVVGLDVCDAAIQKARQWSSISPDGNFIAFVNADFFTWEPPEPFHLIFDYTFFCAIDPSLRSAWARRMYDLLRPDGELITLMYLVEGQESGPPFNATVLDYEEVLNPLGFVIVSIEDNGVAVEARKGMEKMARWKKMAN
ncbi:probable thiocyanate methyltransferase 2 [Triticum urartu]|uniref:Thiol methyltransferase 2 n=1 Tax=Triticum urartu TaxID=4572 RepID=A0A8R7UBH7_TRIUA|nr:probable thiocyanate methyltransferase 2 [Triticum urartu]XP_048573900.1 probable thiocyanate methyltransferase 2 [Triticum urartu]